LAEKSVTKAPSLDRGSSKKASGAHKNPQLTYRKGGSETDKKKKKKSP